MTSRLLLVALCTFIASPAFAQSANVPNFDLEGTTTSSSSLPSLAQQDLIGDYQQPRWTVSEGFSFSDAYVLPSGHVSLEFNGEIRQFDSRYDVENEFYASQGVAIGLPGRIQLGASLQENYINNDVDNSDLYAEMNMGGYFEMRHAIGQWGDMLWNPAIALSYSAWEEDAQRDALGEQPSDSVGVKLLLADNLGDYITWTFNVGVDRDNTNLRTWTLSASGGAHVVAIDNTLNIGFEYLLESTNSKPDRKNYETNAIYVGPSFVWRADNTWSVRAAALAGVTGKSNDVIGSIGLKLNF